MYLLVVGVLFTLTACGGGDTCTQECADDAACEASTEEGGAGHVSDAADGTDDECADDCAKACCLGCKATEGEKNVFFWKMDPCRVVLLIIMLI